MNRHTNIPSATSQSLHGLPLRGERPVVKEAKRRAKHSNGAGSSCLMRPTGETGAPNLSNSTLVTADARKVSGRDFLDALTGNSPEKRAADRQLMVEQCIRAVLHGDTYGWPPMMVAECHAIIAERASLVEVEQLPGGGVAL